MQIALITALGIGSATVVGALLGFIIKKVPHRLNDALLGFAAGVMLSAAILGLILPSLEYGNNVWITVMGIFLGGLFLNFADYFTPHLHSLAGIEREQHAQMDDRIDKILLFVVAIAIHNFPEGLAAGVSFGTGNLADALTVAGGIALQNIPEGMIIIAPLLSAGVSHRRTFFIALSTGLVEIVGTLVGYLAVSTAIFVLPFALAFAGGTMLYVISDEMIPETHGHGYERAATFSLLFGFGIMLLLDFYLN